MPRHDDPLSILQTVAATLNQVPDVREAMTRILPRLTRALGLKTAWVFLFESGGAGAADVAYTGLPPALRERRALALREGSCHCQDSFRAGELTRAVNIVRCTRLQRATGDRGGLVFHASVPLLAKDRRLGILNVASPGRELFSRDVLRVLSAVGQQVAVAVERSELFREASRRAQMLSRLEQAAGRLASLHENGAVAREVVRALTEDFGFRAAAFYAQVETSWAALAHAGSGRQPRPVAGRVPIPSRNTPGEAFHPGGPDPALIHTIPGAPGPRAVIAAAGPVLDATVEAVLASYAVHVGLSLTNTILMTRQAELGAWAERQRLARELHDAISQRLFSSNLALAALAETGPGDADFPALLNTARTHTATALREMKELVYELAPPAAQTLGLALTTLASSGGVRTAVEVDPPLREPVRVALLRIAQEAVQNALRHAPGALVEVRLRRVNRKAGPHLALTIQDRGPGFEPERARRGLGLRHMEERALQAGARLSVRSGARGTRVEALMPWADAVRGESPA